MSKSSQKELFFTAKSESEDGTYNEFDVYRKGKQYWINVFDGSSGWEQPITPSDTSMAGVIREIEILFEHLKITSIKYPWSETFQKYK